MSTLSTLFILAPPRHVALFRVFVCGSLGLDNCFRACDIRDMHLQMKLLIRLVSHWFASSCFMYLSDLTPVPFRTLERWSALPKQPCHSSFRLGLTHLRLRPLWF